MKDNKKRSIIISLIVVIIIAICIGFAIRKKTVSDTVNKADVLEQDIDANIAERTPSSDDGYIQKTEDEALNVKALDKNLPFGEDEDGISITQELNNEFTATSFMDSPFVKERAYMEDGELKMYIYDEEADMERIINVKDWVYYEDVTPILENFDITREDTGDLRIKGVLSFTQGEVMGIRLVVKDLNGNEIVVCEYDTTMYNMATLGKQVVLNQELKHATQWYDLNHLGAGKYLYELDASGQYFSMQKVVSGELEILEEKDETPVAEQSHNTEQKGGVYNTVGADGKVVDFTAGGVDGMKIIDEYRFSATYDAYNAKEQVLSKLTEEQGKATLYIGGKNDCFTYVVPKVEEKVASDGFKYRMYDYGGIEYYMENAYHKPTMSLDNIGSMNELISTVAKNGGKEYISMKELIELMDNDASILGLESCYQMWYKGTCEGDSRDTYVSAPGRKGDMIGAVEDFIEATGSLDTNVVHDKLDYAWNNMTLDFFINCGYDESIMVMPSNEGKDGIIMDYTLAYTNEYTGEEICRDVGWDTPSLKCSLTVTASNGHGNFELCMSATDESNIMRGTGCVEPAQRAELIINYSFNY